MTWRAGRGKTQLIKELHEKGYSYRRSERAVNAVFDCIMRGLRRGESVEIPGGTVQCLTNHRKARRAFLRLRSIGTTDSNYRFFHYAGGGRRIRFTPDKTLALDPAIDAANEKKADETWGLLVSLLGHEPTRQFVGELKLPFKQQPDKMIDGMLRRLRHLTQYGRRFTEYDLKRKFYGLVGM